MGMRSCPNPKKIHLVFDVGIFLVIIIESTFLVMSVKIIKSELARFFRDAHPELLVLKGQWGIGKTYHWEAAISKVRKDELVNLETYSYVSLFGLNTLKEIRDAILIKQSAFSKPDESDSEESGKSKLAWAGMALKVVEDSPFLKNFTGELVTQAAFLGVKNTLICFDDIERRGEGIRLKDFLGLCTQLKEEKKCKIVVILNEERLEEGKSEFQKHGEKLFDRVLTLDISPTYAFEQIFKPGDSYYSKLREHCIALGINNIRTLQRVKRHVIEMGARIEGYSESIQFSVIQSLVLLVWANYDHEGTSPTIDYILKRFDSLGLIDGEYSPQEESWNIILKEYGFGHPSKIEHVLGHYVLNGFIDDQRLIEVLDERKSDEKYQENRNRLGRAWDLFNNSLDDNVDEIASAFEESFSKGISSYSPADLNAAVQLLRELNKGEVADKLIAAFINFNHGNNAIFDLRDPAYRIVKFDPEIESSFTELRSQGQDWSGIGEVLKKAFLKDGYLEEDEIKFLATFETEDYYDFFKSERSEYLRYYIKTCLDLAKHAAVTDEKDMVVEKASAAFKKLLSENSTNMVRNNRLYKVKLD